MAIKKSELYSTLWKSCDELRGGMDASQYKDNRKGIFMIDAKSRYMKDGAKNRLREQDIEAHLQGGLQIHDIEQMKQYRDSCPALRSEVFKEGIPRTGYATLKVDKSEIRNTIQKSKDYQKQSALFHSHFEDWKAEVNSMLEFLCEGANPKSLVKELGDSILRHFNKDILPVDAYDVYDALMNYWNETMQDDCYLISEDGWKATLYVPQPADKKTKNGEIKKAKRKEAKTIADFACDLLPVEFVVKRYCNDLYETLLAAEERLSEYESQNAEMEYKDEYLDEPDVIARYIDIRQEISASKSVIKVCHTELKDAVQECYDTLTSSEVKEIVINDKWYGTLSKRLDDQMQQVGQQLTSSVIALVERYENTLTELNDEVVRLKKKVEQHLLSMSFVI